MARGLFSWDLLQYKPKEALSTDEWELFEQLLLVEEKLEQERMFLRILPGRKVNQTLLEGIQRFSGLVWEKLRILDELAEVPLDIDPQMLDLQQACWEVNACSLVAARRY